MSVGIVVVSHSRPLAEAAVALADIMVREDRPKVAIAAGLADGGFGTDASEIISAIKSVHGPDGTVLFVDLGSAVMNAETAVELLGMSEDEVRVLAAPFVEGITAGMVRAAMGGSLAEVSTAAESVLEAKLIALGRRTQSDDDRPQRGEDTVEAEVILVNDVGLHARPATRLAALADRFDGELEVYFGDAQPADGKSAMSLMALGAGKNSKLRFVAYGRQASELLAAVTEFVAKGLGE